MIPRVYIAGPFSGKDSGYVFQNCAVAVGISHRLIREGIYPVASHVLGLYTQDGGGQSEDWWRSATAQLMLTCNAVLLIDGWKGSDGALGEKRIAETAEMPVFDTLLGVRQWARGFGE